MLRNRMLNSARPNSPIAPLATATAASPIRYRVLALARPADVAHVCVLAQAALRDTGVMVVGHPPSLPAALSHGG